MIPDRSALYIRYIEKITIPAIIIPMPISLRREIFSYRLAKT